MADLKISELTSATTPLGGSEVIPVLQDGANKKTTANAVAALAAPTDLSYTAATRTLASSTGADVVLPVATTTDAGLESAADKTKLDSITVDSATVVRKLVRNNSGVNIAKGQPVYQTGSSGTTITVALADASVEATAAQTLGLAQEAITVGATGWVIAVGELSGINTATLTEGQIVWLSETTGGLTTTRPTQPAHGVVLGYCVKQGAGASGILYVKVDNGLELNELHDVLVSIPLTGQVLRRAADGLWKNATLTAADVGGLATVATTGAYSDLSGRPTLGTAAPLDVAAAGDASASQVVKGNDSRLSDARTPTAHTQAASTISDSTAAGRALLTAADAPAQRTALGLGSAALATTGTAAGNVPVLDGSGLMPSALLPGYVDDVLEFTNLAAFPATGETGKIYVARDTNKTYRWSGSAYIEISPSPGSTDAVPEGSVNLYFTTGRASAAAPVQSVAGRTGGVTLAVGDVSGAAASGAIGSSGLTMAAARLLGRSTAGTGAPEEITIGSNLTLSGGVLSAAAGTPGGSSGQVQFNNAGAFGGISTLTTDGSGNLTLTGRLTNAFSSLASAPAKLFSGTWFTGGTSTTTKPHVLIEPTGSTSTAWSTSGTGLGVNAASGFAGNLLDLQVNGTRKLVINQEGGITGSAGSVFSGFYEIQCGRYESTGYMRSPRFDIGGGGVTSVTLTYDAANIHAQRSGTNAQTFRVYNTFTSSTNYELGKLEWSSNVFRIGTEKGSGGGTARAMELQTDGTTRVQIGAAGDITIPVNGAASLPPLDLNGTWFTGGTATTTKPQCLIEPAGTTSTNWSTSGTGLGVNAASGFAGRLLDLQINGSTAFFVGGGGGGGNTQFQIGGGNNGIPFIWTYNGRYYGNIVNCTFLEIGAFDCRVERDAAGTIAQRNGTNAQTFRVYNTTDAGLTNFERGFMRWNTNVLQVGTEKGGTGSARSLELQTDGTTRLTVAANGATISAASGTALAADHRLTGTAPASATATGTAGDIRYDADYIYICTATNTWKRAALSTW